MNLLKITIENLKATRFKYQSLLHDFVINQPAMGSGPIG